MVLNLVGLGLRKNSVTAEALEKIKESDKVYLENYTVDFPYSLDDLKEELGAEILELNREKVEDESIVEEAKEKNVSLLIYGDVLAATTHLQLINKCKEEKVAFEIYHNASILTAVGETGLSLYKFGKVSSMPTWTENYKPASFMEYVKENKSIDAHSLILVDIGLDLKDAKLELQEAAQSSGVELGKVILCSRVGTEDMKVFYGELPDECDKPYCFIMPGKLDHVEKNFLERFK